jgi:hypothetical protein
LPRGEGTNAEGHHPCPFERAIQPRPARIPGEKHHDVARVQHQRAADGKGEAADHEIVEPHRRGLAEIEHGENPAIGDEMKLYFGSRGIGFLGRLSGIGLLGTASGIGFNRALNLDDVIATPFPGLARANPLKIEQASRMSSLSRIAMSILGTRKPT